MPVRSNVRRINKFDTTYNPETIKQSIENQLESLIDEPVAWQVRLEISEAVKESKRISWDDNYRVFLFGQAFTRRVQQMK